MTTEHLRCLLVDQRAMQLVSKKRRVFGAQVPTKVIQTLRLGQMTVLSKPDDCRGGRHSQSGCKDDGPS